jgi:hypothetical protein
MNNKIIALLKKIETKGFYEQERSYLFAGLYGARPLRRRTIGLYKQWDRKIGKMVRQRRRFVRLNIHL